MHSTALFAIVLVFVGVSRVAIIHTMEPLVTSFALESEIDPDLRAALHEVDIIN